MISTSYAAGPRDFAISVRFMDFIIDGSETARRRISEYRMI